MNGDIDVGTPYLNLCTGQLWVYDGVKWVKEEDYGGDE